MDQEMQTLGLKPLNDKKVNIQEDTDRPSFLGLDDDVNEMDKNFSGLNCNDYSQPSGEAGMNNIPTIEIQDEGKTKQAAESSKPTNANSETEIIKKKFNNNYYARRLSTIGVMTSKNVDSFVNISTMRRKYSLDSKLTSVSLLPSRPPRHNAFGSASKASSSFFKPSSKRSSLNADSKENLTDILHHITHSSLFSARSRPDDSDAMSFQQQSSIAKTNSVLISQTNRSLHAAHHQANMSNTNLTANSTGTADAANNKASTSRLGSNRLLRNRTAKAGISNRENGSAKRRVSFGQIELNQLEIPTVYKYSNVGFEKHKLNPNFYLPDGSLRRKFSLPKLTDTIETIKNCRYLRRNSLDEDRPSHSEVVNIFKDLNPTPNEIRNFDFVHEDVIPYYSNKATNFKDLTSDSNF